MAKPVKGDVVVVPFPFSDLTQTKRRPLLSSHNWKVMTSSSVRSPVNKFVTDMPLPSPTGISTPALYGKTATFVLIVFSPPISTSSSTKSDM